MVSTDTSSATDTDTVNITVGSVNDAPLGTDGAVTTNEDTPYTFTQSDFGFTDVDVPDSLVGGADRHLAGRRHADPVGQRGHGRSGDHCCRYHRRQPGLHAASQRQRRGSNQLHVQRPRCGQRLRPGGQHLDGERDRGQRCAHAGPRRDNSSGATGANFTAASPRTAVPWPWPTPTRCWGTSTART